MDLLIGLAVGLVLGAAGGWLLAWARAAAERARVDELRRQAGEIQARLSEMQSRLEEAGRHRAAAEARAKDLEDLQAAFRSLAGEALLSTQQKFLDLATQKLADREEAMKAAVAPLNASLGKVEEGLVRLESQRTEIRGQVDRLSEALRNSGARGRWGEIQLRRILELAGMQEHCDFVTQATVATEEGRRRPDVVIHLPGGRDVVLDAKVPIDAFLKALEAPSEEARGRLLKDHAQNVRTQVALLARKEYWEHFDRAPEFVVLFMPGEAFLSAALERDPGLLDEAAEKRVVLATPTILIAMLKTVHFSWQQQKMAENAQRISEAGRELHDRAALLAEHLATMGRSLGAAVEAYNRTVGSLEIRVLPSARRLGELGAAGTRELAAPAPIEKAPRLPDPGRGRPPEDAAGIPGPVTRESA